MYICLCAMKHLQTKCKTATFLPEGWEASVIYRFVTLECLRWIWSELLFCSYIIWDIYEWMNAWPRCVRTCFSDFGCISNFSSPVGQTPEISWDKTGGDIFSPIFFPFLFPQKGKLGTHLILHLLMNDWWLTSSLIHLLSYFLNHLLSYLFTYSFNYLFINISTRLLYYLFTHLLNQSVENLSNDYGIKRW